MGLCCEFMNREICERSEKEKEKSGFPFRNFRCFRGPQMARANDSRDLQFRIEQRGREESLSWGCVAILGTAKFAKEAKKRRENLVILFAIFVPFVVPKWREPSLFTGRWNNCRGIHLKVNMLHPLSIVRFRIICAKMNSSRFRSNRRCSRD